MRVPVLAAIIGLMTMPALAQSAPEAAHPSAGVVDLGIVDEVRIGVHAYQAHYSLWPFGVTEYNFDHIENISFDVLFRSPDIAAFDWIGSPRPELGVNVNFNGGDSALHAGLTWQFRVMDSPFFLEGTFGAAIHNGYLNDAPAGRNNLGCRVNFYERFGIGADITEQATAVLTYQHMSNGDLCLSNEGYSNVGLRLGWKF